MAYRVIVRPLLPLALLLAAACDSQSSRRQDTASGEVAGPGAARVVPVTTASAEARRHFEAGLKQFDNLRSPDARRHFEQAVAEDSSFALAYAYLAMTEATAKGFFDRVSRAAALADRASDGERLMILALQAGANANPAKQRQYNDQLVAAYPDDARAHLMRGFTLTGQQEFDKGVSEFERATQLDSTFSPAYNALGYGYRSLGRYDDAERAFKRYIALLPNEPNPYDSYAELLLKRGRHAESIEMYRKALAVDSQFISAYQGIAANLMYQEQHDAARAEAQRMLRAAPDDGGRRNALLLTAITYLDEGKPDDALAQLRRREDVAKQGGDMPAVAQDAALMGDVQLEVGRPDQALAQYDRSLKAVERLPLSDEIKADARLQHRAHLARVALKRGDLATAKREADAFTQGAEQSGNPAHVREAHELLGLVAIESRDYDGGLTHLQKADQQDPYVLYAIARAHDGTGDQAKAREIYSKVAALNELPTVRYATVRRAARAKQSHG